ncbi:Retrovirus-related Pol polyprotein from transposon TNT 1-94 [Symbiodinium microadriaticum]|uniref:Retrovirus-related Pol polyprotein from transposon TNT 1-94 n=1 Tax=Symbiodinium microadriaticum TaxID=2951 RepID=A0A1Q9CM36_SYMMI|nr:Retrovirus-related Pol polyprotein from transposon TNT 1-94 [Symbiodinium microadriaticum]
MAAPTSVKTMDQIMGICLRGMSRWLDLRSRNGIYLDCKLNMGLVQRFQLLFLWKGCGSMAQNRSAGVPREMVQAEVAKQLDGAMTEVYQNMIARISTERQRTEDAEREAQQLRLQLELMEQRMSGQMFEPPPMPTPAETSEPPSLLSRVNFREVDHQRKAVDVGFYKGIAPPPVPMVASSSLGANERVLTAMAKGIETLLQNQSSKGERPETVKPGITELPILPPYTPETGSIDLINWVTHITPIMEDLSDSSSLWWSSMLKQVMEWYAKYSVAAPLERVQMLPVGSAISTKPEWARVERRATAMMLSAIPGTLKEEVIAVGGVNTVNLLAKLFSTYQPGNRQEKALVLTNLEKPTECQDAASAVEALRKWALWRRTLSYTIVGSVKYWFVTYYQVLHEVKCMEAFQPLVSAVEKWSSMWSTAPVKRAALMDSGATHPLRRPHDEKEWLEAVNVNVALAGEARTTMKQNSAGTLLSGDELSQVIVPLGRVIDSLGYRLRWSSTECCLERGDELLPLRIVRGCPEVDEATAHRLIQELETRQVPRLHEATMESVRILRNVEVSWWSCLVDYVTNGNVESGKEALMRAMFFGEEEREDLASLLLRQPNDGGWGYMKQLGLNRRTRKRLMRASTWIVRWDPPGFTRKSDVLQCVGRLSEVAYVNVGSLLAQGGFATTWRVLLWAACQGRLGTIMSKDVGATTTEFEAHARHRARVHLLHALSAAGQSYRGSITPRFLVERRRGASMDSVDWMCDGKAQRYCDEMNLPDPMFQEEQAIEIVNGLTGIVYGAAGRVRLAKMSRDASWRLHIMRNHQPFRRDCALCVRNAATGRQHRATLHPTGYTLSVDVAGPLKGFGKSPDGKYFKYFVIGAFRIPLLDGGVTYDEELRGHPIPEEPELDDDPVLSDEDNADELLEEEEDVPPIAQERRDEEEWKKLRDKFKAPLMTETLYFCVPVNSKKSLHVLPALQQMVIDIRGLGYPVTRIHSDRGGELRSNAIKRWVLSQGILRTTSTGSEPAENGVAEAGVRFLKRRGRILLDAAGLGREHWPTAIQTAALQQRCEKLALVNPMPVAYGAKVYVKTKKYKTGDVESMKPHWTQGRYLGPSTDVRGGHVILKSTGTFLTTTHVRVATEPPNLDEVAPTIIVDSEDLPPLPPPDVPPEAGASAPEHLGERPRVESPSSSGLGRGRSTKVRKNDAAEHLGERHRVESPSSSGLGRIFDDGAELPPYPKGPLDEGAELPPYPKGPPISYSPPVARVRGKSPGVRMKAMRLEGDYEDMVEALGDDYGEGEADPVYQEEIMMRVLKAQEKQAVEAVAVELLNAGDFSREACQRLLRALGGFHTRWKTPRATVGQGMILGAYVRGGSFGITTYGRELPNTLKFLNKFLHIRLQYVMPGSTCTWTTLALQRANAIPAHRDVHNQRGARNYVMEIADETLEGLWVEGAEGAQPVEGGDGVMQPHELQLEDGQVLRGRLHSIEEPVAFDPRARHALVNEAGMKWVLSAYTPSGVHQLLQADVDYLFQHGFPVTGTGVALPTVRAIQRVAYGTGASWETRPMSDASLVQPEFVTLSGSRVAGAQEEVDASIGYEGDEDGDEAAGDWELFVESSEDSCVVEEDVDYQDTQQPRLCRLCSSEDPGCERDLLQRVYEGHLQSDECSEHIQEAMAANLEEWEVYFPMIAKVEPEFTENIEALIDGLEEPLRHTHNVNPREVRASVEKWRASIEKELKVVEKGFERVTVDEIKNYKRTHQVQELPAKLVYTLKPPSDEAVPGTEAAKCKRKSRIVCCGNFNDQDPGDVFASGAAAESLRCTLVLAALRRWVAGGLDITGAFMLTPLPRDKTLIVITPPNILICLGLASPQERWVLTRAMYGLRQAPHLWSEFRDNVIKGMQFELHGSKWKFRQGGAEPNIWYLFQEDASTKVPAGVLLIYVDDLLLLGPPDLVNAMASSIQSTWKTSTLELVEPCRGIRFLGCEIETNEARDAYWIHQKPYVVELLRHHNIPSTARSPIPCPKDMLSLQIEEDEDKGDEHDLRQAQKLCGELLWLSQRSRPDIAFPVSIMGSLLTRAAPRSIAIGQRLLSYLQRTMGMALELRPTEGGFEAWSDCSFAPNGSKPHSGMTITWDKAVISWRSGRQPFTCLSTAEGELVAAIETLTLSMSMKAIVDEFGVPLPATTLCIDNQAALVLANPSSTASWRTRHLRIRSSFLREKVDQGEVKLLYVPGKIQLADLLTKGFPRQRLEELCGLWGLVDMFEAASQMKLVKVMVMMTMLVQTARGSLITKDPIPLETSWELYVVLALVVVAVISFWECGWSVWYTLSGGDSDSDGVKRQRVDQYDVGLGTYSILLYRIRGIFLYWTYGVHLDSTYGIKDCNDSTAIVVTYNTTPELYNRW